MCERIECRRPTVVPPHTPRVLNMRRDRIPAGAVRVDRRTIWGNPFVIGRDGTREGVIAEHRRWLRTQPELMARIKELAGRDLVCWCAPLPCHADTLIGIANPGLFRP